MRLKGPFLIFINGNKPMLLDGPSMRAAVLSLNVINGYHVYDLENDTGHWDRGACASEDVFVPADEVVRYYERKEPDGKWAIVMVYNPRSLVHVAIAEEHGLAVHYVV